MAYQKINVELVVFADEAASVVAELNQAIDQLEVKHTIFGDAEPSWDSTYSKTSPLATTFTIRRPRV